jgi:hypothetical protein
MATFGQGINPQFGAIDYSPILKGSVAGAEMAAKGSQMIGQGLANLGQEVGAGIQKYAEQKKKNAERDGRVNAALGAIQANAKIMDRYGRKEDAAALRLAGYNLIQESNLDTRAAMADNAVGSFLQGQQIEAGARQRQLGEQAAQYVRAATQAGGNAFSPVVKDAAGGYSPMSAEAQTLGQQQMMQRDYMQSQINENNAQAAARTSATGKEQEVRNATVAVGKALERLRGKDGNIVFTGGLTREDLGTLSPEGMVLANKLFTEASTNQASLNSILDSTERAKDFAIKSLEANINPVITVIAGVKHMRMPLQNGGYQSTPIADTDEEKIVEHSKATKKVLDDYFKAGATNAAKFVASAALFKLNPYLAQSGGVYLIDDLLKKADPNYVEPPPALPGSPLPGKPGEIKIDSIRAVNPRGGLGGD